MKVSQNVAMSGNAVTSICGKSESQSQLDREIGKAELTASVYVLPTMIIAPDSSVAVTYVSGRIMLVGWVSGADVTVDMGSTREAVVQHLLSQGQPVNLPCDEVMESVGAAEAEESAMLPTVGTAEYATASSVGA